MAKTLVANLESDFFLRRLQSLTGIIPIGGFMVFHIMVNSIAMFEPENYNTIIDLLRAMPFLLPIEIMFIYGPIAFHAIYGIIICKTSKPNQMQYSGLENWRYILQRITGMLGFFYLIYHMFQFRNVEDLDYNYIAVSLAGNGTISWLPELPLLNPFSIYWLYIIGVVSLVYHFANGMWSFCITWGITVGKKSQTIMSYVALVTFIALTAVSVSTVNHLREAGLEIIASGGL